MTGFPDSILGPVDGYARCGRWLGEGFDVALGPFPQRRTTCVATSGAHERRPCVKRIEFTPDQPSSEWLGAAPRCRPGSCGLGDGEERGVYLRLPARFARVGGGALRTLSRHRNAASLAAARSRRADRGTPVRSCAGTSARPRSGSCEVRPAARGESSSEWVAVDWSHPQQREWSSLLAGAADRVYQPSAPGGSPLRLQVSRRHSPSSTLTMRRAAIGRQRLLGDQRQSRRGGVVLGKRPCGRRISAFHRRAQPGEQYALVVARAETPRRERRSAHARGRSERRPWRCACR